MRALVRFGGAAPARGRVRRRNRHRDLPVRPPRAADPARRRRDELYALGARTRSSRASSLRFTAFHPRRRRAPGARSVSRKTCCATWRSWHSSSWAASLLSRRVAWLLERPFFSSPAGAGRPRATVSSSAPASGSCSSLRRARPRGRDGARGERPGRVETFVVTGAYAVGAALPMLAVAVGGQRLSTSLSSSAPMRNDAACRGMRSGRRRSRSPSASIRVHDRRPGLHRGPPGAGRARSLPAGAPRARGN